MTDVCVCGHVKLFSLNAQRQWDDRGTGYISSCYSQRLQSIMLLVRNEHDGSWLLKMKVDPSTCFQRQNEVVIVWSTRGYHFDMALSFRDKNDFEEIWNLICRVQRVDPSAEITRNIGGSEDEGFVEDTDLPPE